MGYPENLSLAPVLLLAIVNAVFLLCGRLFSTPVYRSACYARIFFMEESVNALLQAGSLCHTCTAKLSCIGFHRSASMNRPVMHCESFSDVIVDAAEKVRRKRSLSTPSRKASNAYTVSGLCRNCLAHERCRLQPDPDSVIYCEEFC